MKKRTRARAGWDSCGVVESAGERFLTRTLIAVMLGTAGIAPLVTHAEVAPLQSAAAAASSASSQPNLAFFYAANPPVGELQAFDSVVVDPATGFDPAAHPLAHTTWIARTNGAESAGSAEAFLSSQIEPLWQRGYRGFLLDTPAAIAAAGRIHDAHPDARLVAGGADVMRNALPYAKSLYAVVGDSLIRGVDDGGQLLEVAESLRAQRIAAARAFTQQTRVPVVSLEYCARNDRQCARDTAARVVSAGMLPYVTSKARDVVGIGKIEVLPRKILVV